MSKSKIQTAETIETGANMNFDNSIHFILQGKGGAGKSISAYLLSQFIQEKTNNDFMAFDTDPNNKTLSSYKSLNVTPINLINPRTEMIDQSNFDILIEKILSNDVPSVVDTGSGEFLNIVNYMESSSILEILEDSGKEVFIHVVVNYGQSMKDTLMCLQTLLVNFPTAKYVVWKNEYYGYSDKPIEDISFIKDSLDSIKGFVTLEKLNTDTHEKDFLGMIKQGLTFNDVINDNKGGFGIINKSRLKKLKTAYLGQLDAIFN